VVFGGPDGCTLFLPARDALYAVRTRVPGAFAQAARPRIENPR
jgi:hypothetical protein